MVYKLNKNEVEVISNDISNLLTKKVIACSSPETRHLLFTRNRKYVCKRKTPNLKNFKHFSHYNRFIMEAIDNVVNLVKSNAYMTSIDLEDTFFSVLKFKDHQEYFVMFMLMIPTSSETHTCHA